MSNYGQVEEEKDPVSVIDLVAGVFAVWSSLLTSLDPLPSAELHNILQEFASHLPSQSTQPLSKLIPLDAEGKWDKQAESAVTVKWILGYTVVSSSRNVVEDKG
jgi:hypothetical protein